MAAQGQAPNVDLFDAYFRRADLDRDGRISGSEAVAFFQGSGLPKHVLAQIWVYADHNRIGFLGRAEFYNALKLVTVAQSQRDLTPDIVKAALYGPASAKIPAPQINLASMPAPQLNSAAAAPAPQMGAVAPPASQNLGFRGPQIPSNAAMNRQYTPSQENQLIRPPQTLSGSASRPMQGVAFQGLPGGGPAVAPHLPNSNMSSEWVAERAGGAPMGTTSQISNRGISPSTAQDGFGLAASGLTASRPPRPQATLGMMPSEPPAKDSKAPGVSGNGFASHSLFGRDVFSATPSQTKQDSSAPTFSAGNIPVSSTIVPASTVTQPSVKPSPLESLQSSLTVQPVGGQIQQSQSNMKQNQQVPTQGTSASTSSGISLGAENSSSSQAQLPWPRMTPSDVQKYTKVFVEVDRDRDGKISGEEARNLFLSWRLPREVLKQVWDLSDQDNDSMLSLREFCTALYLMERYREGRPLPAVLPNSIMLDFPTTGQSSIGYSNAAWGPMPGLQQQRGITGPSPRQVAPATGARPPIPLAPQANEEMQTNQPKSRVPVLEKHLVNQLSKEEQNSLNSKFQEATEADKKVEELEKEILDSREKIQFCRTKMQELVLYKSRCDNRLNEITERASADKHEVESLAKKYEEKCKQVGDIASKLTMEEATFRDVQERKMELYQAIVKMEEDGGADGILQVRADRIQSDLDELVKSLNERCKKYGLRVRPTSLAELPFGWQPGIQEGAADWDEDWDKFEDEGFTFVKELTLDVQNVIAPPKLKSTSVREEKASTIESPTAASSDADVKLEKPPTMGEQALDNGSAFNKNEDDSAKSGQGSPVARSAVESPSSEFPDSHFDKTTSADASPRVLENQSDQGGAESFLSGDRNFDEPAWGTFDSNDDVDSVWGFDHVTISKDTDNESQRENYFFGSGDLGLNPIRTESPQAGSIFPRQSPFTFADSVPSTPLYSTTNSPPRYSEASEHSFDNFQRFDSFSTHDSGFFQPRDSFARFDSMRSTNDFDHGRETTFARFDSMRSTNDFDHSRETTFARFDSMRSTNDFDHGHGFPSFDDSDPFGSSGPFRTSLESQTPRRGSDNWSAF